EHFFELEGYIDRIIRDESLQDGVLLFIAAPNAFLSHDQYLLKERSVELTRNAVHIIHCVGGSSKKLSKHFCERCLSNTRLALDRYSNSDFVPTMRLLNRLCHPVQEVVVMLLNSPTYPFLDQPHILV